MALRYPVLSRVENFSMRLIETQAQTRHILKKARIWPPDPVAGASPLLTGKPAGG
jgi:hypothetical protein